jgi:hypothetical protein
VSEEKCKSIWLEPLLEQSAAVLATIGADKAAGVLIVVLVDQLEVAE